MYLETKGKRRRELTGNKFIKIKAFAKKSLMKKAGLGIDIDSSQFHTNQPELLEFQNMKNISNELKQTLINVGIDTSQYERAGTYIQEGNRVGFCQSTGDDIEVLPIADALKKYDWLEDYYWKAVLVDTDKYTAETELSTNLQGYFIYAKEGAVNTFPLQSCLFMNIDGMKQIVHNIVIAEPNSHLNIITGCTVHPTRVKKALHLGTSEFYLKKGSEVSFTMVHYWSEKTLVRPRTGIIQDENSKFISNYVVMSPVESLQSNPVTYLKGDNSSAYFQTLIYGKLNSRIDVGARAYLNGKNSRAEMISKVIAKDDSYVTARGLIVGKGENSKGHLECQGLILSDNARIDSIPEINGLNPNISITHEAAIGKIAEEQILYLMSRGLSEDESRDLIISGFLEADTSHLPPNLARETEKLIKLASEEGS